MPASVLTLLLLACAPVRAESSATLKGFDVYRSRYVTADRVMAGAAPELQLYMRLSADDKPGSEASLRRAQEALEAKLRAMGPLAFLHLSFRRYFDGTQKTAYLTIDAVDEQDAAARMPFVAAPHGPNADPSGALDAWKRYSALGDALSREGKIAVTDRPECPGLYCSYGSATPELAALEKAIFEAAKQHKKDLREALAGDADPDERAAAMYVLAYNSDGKTVVDAALDALRDPAEQVRGAALQVLADIALYHKSFMIDARRVMPALDYPTVSDRSKALAVVQSMTANPAYRPSLIAHATPTLLALLRLLQPANHDLAFTALTVLSQQSFDQRDFESWGQWVYKNAKPAAVVDGVTTRPRP